MLSPSVYERTPILSNEDKDLAATGEKYVTVKCSGGLKVTRENERIHQKESHLRLPHPQLYHLLLASARKTTGGSTEIALRAISSEREYYLYEQGSISRDRNGK